jgi:hypothetical protein
MAAFAPQVVAVQFNEVEGVEEDALLVMADEVERGNAVCHVVDTVLVDQETVYAPRHGNDRLLLGLKGSLNEYVRNGTVE